MVTFLAHGKADYAGAGSSSLHDTLDCLLYGALCGIEPNASMPVKEITDAYFLLQAPLNRLRNVRAAAYSAENGWKRVTYADGSYIAVQYETQEIRVFIDGAYWIYDGAAFIPNADGWTVYVAHDSSYYYGALMWKPDVPVGTKFVFKPIGVEEKEIYLDMGEKGVAVYLPIGIAYAVTVV